MGMSDAVLTLDTTELSKSLPQFLAHSKRSAAEVMLEFGKNFLRRAVAIIPPSQGKANQESKKRGEAAVMADLRRIFEPSNQDFIDFFIRVNGGNEQATDFGHKGAAAIGLVYDRVLKKGDMVGWHESRRSKYTGRVLGGGSGGRLNRGRALFHTTGVRARDLRSLDIGLVEHGEFDWFANRVKKRVGLLAGGFNASAEKLGYRMPAWIRRHGTGRGDVIVELTGTVLRIVMTNDVKFTGTVKGLRRAMQTALDQQITAMNRRLDYFIRKNKRASGLG